MNATQCVVNYKAKNYGNHQALMRTDQERKAQTRTHTYTYMVGFGWTKYDKNKRTSLTKRYWSAMRAREYIHFNWILYRRLSLKFQFVIS